MESLNTNDAVDHGPATERWLTVYKNYLVAAVALSVFGLARFIVSNSDQITSEELAKALVWGGAQIGLFAGALWSTGRVGEKWVRTLHLTINGVAATVLITGFLPFFFNDTYILNIVMRFGNIFVFPVGALVPWQLVGELPLAYLVVTATSFASLTLSAYFFFRWLKPARPTPVMTTDGQSTSPDAPEQQSKSASSGIERLGGLITFVIGIVMVSSGLSGGSLFLIVLGAGLILAGLVLMIFGRWSLFLWW